MRWERAESLGRVRADGSGSPDRSTRGPRRAYAWPVDPSFVRKRLFSRRLRRSNVVISRLAYPPGVTQRGRQDLLTRSWLGLGRAWQRGAVWESFARSSGAVGATHRDTESALFQISEEEEQKRWH